MEKPTDLTCEKCGKPLVIKWGKHGSFLACTGYPDFPSRSAEADLEKLEKEIVVRRQRTLKESATRREKIQVRYQGELDRLEKQIVERKIKQHSVAVGRQAKIKAWHAGELEKLEKLVSERQLDDGKATEHRLQSIQARYPQMDQFYSLELKDGADGVTLSWQRKEGFCTYTRELTVDLPDVDKADLSEQGEEEYCENCGRPMVLKKGRFGTFLACTGFPDCKTTKQIGQPQKKADVQLDEKCPQCDSNLVQKFGRFGEFTACSNYPKCKYVKQKTIGMKCPECSEGDIIERRSKKGKTFFGCNRYPDCEFVAWNKPVAEKCPDCGGAYLVEKFPKAGPILQCPNPECKYKRDVEPAELTAQ
jgi:ssDNA-binding Zn-finger/Zn-ribbon topoisomerase 1